MKSIKPGRGPSMMGGVVGIFMIGFGILWTVIAAQASGIFAIFGVLWTCVAIAMTVYNFKNATGKNRYSAYDITDENEEPDPLNQRFGNPQTNTPKKNDVDNKFCPYCGTPVAGDFEFCNNCGRNCREQRSKGASNMKNENVHKFLLGISALLVLGFAVHTIVDAVRYDSMLTSFPFYAFIIAHAVEYLVPALIICVAGLICKKKFAKKED